MSRKWLKSLILMTILSSNSKIRWEMFKDFFTVCKPITKCSYINTVYELIGSNNLTDADIYKYFGHILVPKI